MKIKFLEVQKNMYEKQQQKLSEKEALISDLIEQLSNKKQGLDEAQVKYYETLDEADEKAYMMLKEECDNLEKELKEAQKSKALLQDFVLAYSEEKLIKEVEEYIEATGFSKKVQKYIDNYNKLLKDAEELNRQYTDLQVACRSLGQDVNEIAREVKYIKDADLMKSSIKDRYETEKEKIDFRNQTIEVKKIKGEF